MDSIEAGVWSLDLKTKKYNFSQGIEKIYGYPLHAFYDDTSFWKGIVHPDDFELVDIHDKEIFSGKSLVHEYRIIQASGEIRMLRNRITPIFDKANHFINWLA